MSQSETSGDCQTTPQRAAWVRQSRSILLVISTSTLRAWIKILTQTLKTWRDLEILAKRRERGGSGADLAREKIEGAALGRDSTAATALGHRETGAARRDRRKRRGNRPPEAPGRGLYAPAVGSPDALNEAPDASGDHRTHAQRGLQNGIAPDDRHRTLALASGASGHNG